MTVNSSYTLMACHNKVEKLETELPGCDWPDHPKYLRRWCLQWPHTQSPMHTAHSQAWFVSETRLWPIQYIKQISDIGWTDVKDTARCTLENTTHHHRLHDNHLWHCGILLFSSIQQRTFTSVNNRVSFFCPVSVYKRTHFLKKLEKQRAD